MFVEKGKWIKCPFCGKNTKNPIYRNSVTESQREKYLAKGISVQEIFEDSLSEEARELLIAGTCYACQDEYFSWKSKKEVPEEILV